MLSIGEIARFEYAESMYEICSRFVKLEDPSDFAVDHFGLFNIIMDAKQEAKELGLIVDG